MTTKPQVSAPVVRRFEATTERVFDAWLDPGLIGRWMFGPALRDEEVMRISLDPRVGGKFSFVVRRQREEIDHVGEYLEIVRPRRLAFTWGVKSSSDSSRISIDIVPLERGCELTVIHELHPDWSHFAARTEAGWAKMLNALASIIE